MINSNVIRAVGEALKAHNVQPREGERMGDAVASALHISDAEAEVWLEALTEGCTVEQANARVGITSTAENEPFLVAVARTIGSFVGSVTP